MRADLHIHSLHSGDCELSVDAILSIAEKKGMGALSVADHNSLAGSLEAMERAEGIIVLPAMEVTTEWGHLLAYHITEEVPRGLEVGETVDRVHELDGIAVAPHPYRVWSGLGERAVRENGFDAIEVRNGRSLGAANRKALALARELDLPMVAGSDAHSADSIGRTYTSFPEDCRSVEEMVRAILENRVMVGGEERGAMESVGYTVKCVSQWIGRGMRRI
ncbi:MAG: PHP domain-containing protein [Methanomassiliicoccales archaeon]